MTWFYSGDYRDQDRKPTPPEIRALPLWYVHLDDYEPFYVRAATRSKARYMVFQQYCEAWSEARRDFRGVVRRISVARSYRTDIGR